MVSKVWEPFRRKKYNNHIRVPFFALSHLCSVLYVTDDGHFGRLQRLSLLRLGYRKTSSRDTELCLTHKVMCALTLIILNTVCLCVYTYILYVWVFSRN